MPPNTYVEETNHLSRQWRAAETAGKVKLKKVMKAIEHLVNMADEGDATRGLVDKFLTLEAQKDAIRARMNEAHYIALDIHPSIAVFYRKEVERLSEAFHHPSEQDEAACAIRGFSERVTLFPGAKPGENDCHVS